VCCLIAVSLFQVKDVGILGEQSTSLAQEEATTGHDIHPNYVELLKCGISNRQKRLFLESWHSMLNTDAVNKCQPLPKAYLPFIVPLRDQNMC